MALGDVGRVGGDLVGDDAVLHVLAVGQAEVLLGGDVAEHRGAEPADHRGADRRGDVVVAGGDVGRERTERAERRFLRKPMDGGARLLHLVPGTRSSSSLDWRLSRRRAVAETAALPRAYRFIG